MEFQEYAKDIRLNFQQILTEEGAPGLSQKQIVGIAYACALSTHSMALRETLEKQVQTTLSPEEIVAAKAASSLMAMNNVYYRFTHLAENKEISTIPARLRMSFIGNPGIPKVDFELYCLGVSALAGCGSCINAHMHEVQKQGITLQGIHSTARIASVINAVAQAQRIN